MMKWIAQVEMIRTTADGGGGWCGVVTGMGATPEQALAELRLKGEMLGQQVLQEKAEALEAAEADKTAARKAEERDAWEIRRNEAASKGYQMPEFEDVWQVWQRDEASRGGKPRDERSWFGRFEVADVRLTPALGEGGRSDWLAYGTLAWVGEPQNR